MSTEPHFAVYPGNRLRVQCGGPAVLADKTDPDTGELKPCCCICPCEAENFSDITLYYSATHGCEAAIFGVYLRIDPEDEEGVRIGRVNLNTSLAEPGTSTTVAPPITIRTSILDRLMDGVESCCTLYARLKCELGLDDGGQGSGRCHSGAAALKVIRGRSQETIFDGVCGESWISIPAPR